MPRTFRLSLFLSLILKCLPGAATGLTPAEQRVAAARQVIQTNPKSSPALNDLAAALCRRARETGNVEFFSQADEALQQSLRLSPGNYDAQKLRAMILLGQHDFAPALELARSLNRKVPDDIPVWGMMAEADMALGNYAEAEKAAQWMLDLRPGNGPAFIRSAQFREIIGDLEGAIEFLDEAYRRTPETESEDRAFLLSETARLHLLEGDNRRAAGLLHQVLTFYPDYHLALKGLAVLKTSEGSYEEATALLKRRYAQLKTAESLYDLAEILRKAGHQPEAAAAFDEFRNDALALTAKPYNANRQLIFYYSDDFPDPPKALAIAERESVARHDVYTQDAYAWALYRNGKFAEAKAELDKALAVGIRDPGIFCHAGQVAAAMDDPVASKRYLEEAAPASCGAGH